MEAVKMKSAGSIATINAILPSIIFWLQEFSLCYKIFITVCRYLIITISVCIIKYA